MEILGIPYFDEKCSTAKTVSFLSQQGQILFKNDGGQSANEEDGPFLDRCTNGNADDSMDKAK